MRNFAHTTRNLISAVQATGPTGVEYRICIKLRRSQSKLSFINQ